MPDQEDEGGTVTGRYCHKSWSWRVGGGGGVGRDHRRQHEGGHRRAGYCGGGTLAASDREMSQCYELLIASQPIHILMYNPSSLIGPSTPNMGSGEDETLSNPCSSPTQPTLCNPCNQCKWLSQLSFSIAALSPTNLFFGLCPSLLPSLLTDHSFLFELAFASVFVFMYLFLRVLFFFRLSLSLPSSLPAWQN